MDKQKKLAFLAQLSDQKQFTRWLQTFESFPEGISVIRGDNLIYANNYLRRLFHLDPIKDTTHGNAQHNNQSSVKKLFEMQRIRLCSSTTEEPRETTIWEFIKGDDRVGTFEVVPLVGFQKPRPSHAPTIDVSSEQPLVSTFATTGVQRTSDKHSQLSTQSKSNQFVQLRVVFVRMGTRNEKMLVVTDETPRMQVHQSMLREQAMQNFTYDKIKQIDEDVGTTERILRELQHSISEPKPLTHSQIDTVQVRGGLYRERSGEGLKLAEAVAFEMKKMRFQIRDYQDIHDIVHQIFEPENRRKIVVKACIEEVLGAVKKDLADANVEVSLNYHESTIGAFPGPKTRFRQVLINLFLETIKSIVGRTNDRKDKAPGMIKLNTFRKNEDGQVYLAIDLDYSRCQIDKEKAINTTKIQDEKDWMKILESDVDLSLKIIKILCNKLKWRVVCDPFKNSRYSLRVPLSQADLDQDLSAMAEDNASYITIPRPATSSVAKKDLNKKGCVYFNNYEELDSVEEGQRPQSAIVNAPKQITAVNYIKQARQRETSANTLNQKRENLLIKTITEEPAYENEIDSPSVFDQSTKTLGMNSLSKQKLRQMFVQPPPQQDKVLLMNFTEVDLFNSFAALKIEQAFLDQAVINKVNKAIDDNQIYKWLLIEETDTPINLSQIVLSIRDSYKKAKIDELLQVFYFYQQQRGEIEQSCQQLGVHYSSMPSNQKDLAALLNIEIQQENNESQK